LVGYSADVEIVLNSREDVLHIPTSAILDSNQVLLYQADTQTLEKRTIKTGVSNWEYTEVLEGLASGDRIVNSLEREGVEAGAIVQPEQANDTEPIKD